MSPKDKSKSSLWITSTVIWEAISARAQKKEFCFKLAGCDLFFGSRKEMQSYRTACRSVSTNKRPAIRWIAKVESILKFDEYRIDEKLFA